MVNYKGSCEDCIHFDLESSDERMGQCRLELPPAVMFALGKDQYAQDMPEFLMYPSWSCSFGTSKE